MFLARKITRAKWVDAHLDSGEIPADAVTADLRTRNNALSFWQCGDATEEELDEAVLALAAAAQRVESIDIVWLSYDELRTDGQRLDVTAGRWFLPRFSSGGHAGSCLFIGQADSQTPRLPCRAIATRSRLPFGHGA